MAVGPFGRPQRDPTRTRYARWVDVTESGPPTRGTYRAGEFIVDQNGTWWFCTETGDPGTWVFAGAENTIFQPGILVNGSFGIWQRGAGPFTADGAYCANNWIVDLVGTSTMSVTYDDVNTLDIWSGRCLQSTYTHGSAASRIYQNYRDWQQCRTRIVTFRCWAKSSVANAVRIGLYDGVSRAYSSYHSGGGGWEQLYVTLSVNASNDRLEHELWMEASGTFRFDTADSFPYYFAVPRSAPYWSADPSIERVRCNRWYQEAPFSWRGDAAGNNQTFYVPVVWPEMAGSPSASIVAGTRTNVHGTPTLTVTSESGGYYTIVSAAAGAVSITGDEIDLTVDP